MTDLRSDLAAIKARHGPNGDCACQPYPCDAARALEEINRLRDVTDLQAAERKQLMADLDAAESQRAALVEPVSRLMEYGQAHDYRTETWWATVAEINRVLDDPSAAGTEYTARIRAEGAKAERERLRIAERALQPTRKMWAYVQGFDDAVLRCLALLSEEAPHAALGGSDANH